MCGDFDCEVCPYYHSCCDEFTNFQFLEQEYKKSVNRLEDIQVKAYAYFMEDKIND